MMDGSNRGQSIAIMSTRIMDIDRSTGQQSWGEAFMAEYAENGGIRLPLGTFSVVSKSSEGWHMVNREDGSQIATDGGNLVYVGPNGANARYTRR
jgi:hypothetical protein